MELNEAGLRKRTWWTERGYKLPEFDREAVREATGRGPVWVHFGAGNIFRAFPARAVQELLDQGIMDRGLVAAEGYDTEILERVNRPHDEYSVLVTLKADGTVEKTVVGSVLASYGLDGLKEIFTMDSLQIASFTITEKGYGVSGAEEDFKNGPDRAKTYMGQVAGLLYRRFLAGKKPIAMVSMDNCSHNGDKLFGAVEAYAKHWTENGKADKGFYDYICNPETVSFPWSMIDKITPRPDATVKQMLEDSGFEDVETVITSKNTYVATFVNAEEPQYLVIEDKFPNGRPNLDEGGIIYTDRETVDKVEKMKVCTCLNPLHTALAVYGCLLDYTLIYKEMQDPQLKRLVEIIGYEEGLPVVVDPGIIRPKDFIDEVLQKRVTNPFMPDAPQRIATDTSQKLGIRFGETIKAYVARPDLDVKDLKLIPLVLAGWCRYLMGVDDRGEAMELSSDPLLEVVRPYLANVKLGEVRDFHEDLQPILSNDKIFAVNLYEVGLGETVENYFKELVAGPGAVRATLEKYVK